MKKLLLLLQQGTLVWDKKNRSDNSVNDVTSVNFQSLNSPLQNDNIDHSDNCKNGNNRKYGSNCINSCHENDNYGSYDDNSDSDSCRTSDVTNNNNNAFDGVDNSGIHTAKHYNDQFTLLSSQKEIEETRKSLHQILKNDDSVLRLL